jgi:hypothetical protein
MKKLSFYCSMAVLALSVAYCTPEILNLIPETGKGKYEAELPLLPGAPVPYVDCVGNPLTLTAGHMVTEYNVVKNTNVVNGSLHVVIKDLVFVAPTASLTYKGSFNSTLTARANNGEALTFEARFKMEAEGGHVEKEMEASVKFKAQVNPDGTVTVTNSRVSVECEN